MANNFRPADNLAEKNKIAHESREQIKWKKWPTMQPSDYHSGQCGGQDVSPSWIRWAKGHHVTRPYLTKYATSKWEQSIIDVYELLFDPMKHDAITLLEFGVYYGESMHYYRDFFTNPDAKIVGFDHEPTEFFGKPHGCPYVWPGRHNVFIEKGEQQIPQDVINVCEKYGPFDIIVDDAQHDYPYPTEDVFRICWPYVKEGGFYTIEDVYPDKTKHLLDEIVVKNEGKGLSLHRGYQGFGPTGEAGGLVLILKKTQNRITGLDEVLTED